MERLSDVPADIPDLLPSASAIYARKVCRLTETLNKPEERLQAAETLRTLIEKVNLSPSPELGSLECLNQWLRGAASANPKGQASLRQSLRRWPRPYIRTTLAHRLDPDENLLRQNGSE